MDNLFNYSGMHARLLTHIPQISSEGIDYYIGLRRARNDFCDLLLCKVKGDGRSEWLICNNGTFVPFAESLKEEGHILHTF